MTEPPRGYSSVEEFERQNSAVLWWWKSGSVLTAMIAAYLILDGAIVDGLFGLVLSAFMASSYRAAYVYGNFSFLNTWRFLGRVVRQHSV